MRAWAAALVLLCAACGNREPTLIDGSSLEAFQRTTAQARREIPDRDRLDFDAALKRPPGSRYGDSEAEMEALAREVYNGMTAQEIVDGHR